MLVNIGLIRKLGTTRSGAGVDFTTSDGDEFFTSDNQQFLVSP
jgi:hypothetical protein